MANGAFALFSNTTGASNTAIGSQALFSNTEGGLNTADGRRGLFMNITGSRNTATGFGALSSNTEGDDNTAIGVNALLFNVSGDNNAALGRSAGSDINVSGNVCIGQGVSGEAGVDDSTYIRNVNTTEQSPAEDVAYVTVRLSDGRLGHQPTVMRSASSELQKTAEELKSTVAREEATIAQLKNAMEVLTAQFKEHPESNPKGSAQVEMSKPLTVDVLQRDRVNSCQLYVIEGYRQSLVVHQVEIPGFRFCVTLEAHTNLSPSGQHFSVEKEICIPILVSRCGSLEHLVAFGLLAC